MRKHFAVIGLGAFGEAVALELMHLGHRVLGADASEERASRLADSLAQAVIVDVTDEEALRELDPRRFDAVLVAVDESIEASVLCTLAVRALGASPVWAQATGPAHRRVLEKLGVERILQPEWEMGLRVARSLDSGEAP